MRISDLSSDVCSSDLWLDNVGQIPDTPLLHISHAHGALPVGAVAVVIAAGTPHRAEAFAACRFAIAAVQHPAPIWKQEHYRDGRSEGSRTAERRVGEGGVRTCRSRGSPDQSKK